MNSMSCVLSSPTSSRSANIIIMVIDYTIQTLTTAKNHSHDRTFLLSRNNPPWQQAAAKLHVEDPVRQTVPEWRYETYLAQWPFNIDATAFCRHAVSLQQQHWKPRIAGLFLRAGLQCSCGWCRSLLAQEPINHERRAFHLHAALTEA